MEIASGQPIPSDPSMIHRHPATPEMRISVEPSRAEFLPNSAVIGRSSMPSATELPQSVSFSQARHSFKFLGTGCKVENDILFDVTSIQISQWDMGRSEGCKENEFHLQSDSCSGPVANLERSHQTHLSSCEQGSSGSSVLPQVHATHVRRLHCANNSSSMSWLSADSHVSLESDSFYEAEATGLPVHKLPLTSI